MRKFLSIMVIAALVITCHGANPVRIKRVTANSKEITAHAVDNMDELDKELEERINSLYPQFRNFVEFVKRYNMHCDYGNQLFSDYDQESIETTLEALEEVHNNF